MDKRRLMWGIVNQMYWNKNLDNLYLYAVMGLKKRMKYWLKIQKLIQKPMKKIVMHLLSIHVKSIG